MSAQALTPSAHPVASCYTNDAWWRIRIARPRPGKSRKFVMRLTNSVGRAARGRRWWSYQRARRAEFPRRSMPAVRISRFSYRVARGRGFVPRCAPAPARRKFGLVRERPPAAGNSRRVREIAGICSDDCPLRTAFFPSRSSSRPCRLSVYAKHLPTGGNSPVLFIFLGVMIDLELGSGDLPAPFAWPPPRRRSSRHDHEHRNQRPSARQPAEPPPGSDGAEIAAVCRRRPPETERTLRKGLRSKRWLAGGRSARSASGPREERQGWEQRVQAPPAAGRSRRSRRRSDAGR